MFPINRNNIDSIAKRPNSKTDSGKTLPVLYNAFKKKTWNIIDVTSEFYVYEMSHFVNNMDRWIHNRNTQNTTKYNRGSIVFLDLGATNFRNEPSFTHPCIVLANRYNMMLVVPCSSKKYGQGYSDVIDATPADGFAKNTGVQVETFRWVHKNRVISNNGKVSGRVLNEIDAHILNITPTYRKEKARFEGMKKELEDAKKEIEALKLKVQELEKTE